MSKKLFIVDVMAMAFRNHHAFGHRPLTTSDGLVVSSLFGCANFLIKLIEEQKPDYLVLATDTSAPTFRHKVYDQYKANRSEMPEELSAQIPLLYKMFDNMHLPLLKNPGFEADDLIGTIVTKHASKDLQCYIVSGDKDFMQLINDNVFLYSPKKGGEVKVVDTAGVSEKFPECKPSQVIDVLALMGDSSDNVPGVPGIGEKGAAKLISTYGSLDEIFKNLDKITNKRQKNGLTENKDLAILSQKLVTIKTDMEIEKDLPDFAYDWQNWSSDELVEMFKGFEFRGLTSRAEDNLAKNSGGSNDTKNKSQETADASTQKYVLANNRSIIENVVATMNKADVFCFDTETTGLDVINDKPIGISVSSEQNQAYYIPLITKHLKGITPDEVVELVSKMLSNSALKVAHNTKFDIQMLRNLGIVVEGPVSDTMLCSYLLDPASKSHGLDYCCENYLGYRKISITTLAGDDKSGPMDEAPLEDLTRYACEDADLTLRLYQHLLPMLKEKNLVGVLQDIEAPLVPVIARMEQDGIFLDAEILASFSGELDIASKALTKEIYDLAGEEFNINSTKQLQKILFENLKIHEELGIKRIKKTKTGFSTDSSVLEKLSEHPMPAKILEYRTVTKLKNTYVDTLPQLINATSHRLHTHFHQTGTATGRLSSSQPNLQNIPIRSDLGKNIRKAFRAKDKDHVIISADYSQVELRILAHIAKEESLSTAFRDGADIHTSTAARIFKLPPEEVDSEIRSRAKAINFGIIYGMGPQRLARTTGVSTAEAKSFIEKYFEGFPKIKDYINQSIESARDKGYTETITGRRRPLPEIHSKDRMTQVNAENIAVNSPIQGSAADLIKLAMINIREELKKMNNGAKMLLQVHDELLFECPRKVQQEVLDMVKSQMESAMDLSVPIKVDAGVGENWLEAH